MTEIEFVEKWKWQSSPQFGSALFDCSKDLLKDLQELEGYKQVSVEPVVMQKTADELLPCPFCGGEASIGTTRISDKRTAELNERTNGFFINCKICGANNNCLHLGYATKEIAQHHWNTRK